MNNSNQKMSTYSDISTRDSAEEVIAAAFGQGRNTQRWPGHGASCVPPSSPQQNQLDHERSREELAGRGNGERRWEGYDDDDFEKEEYSDDGFESEAISPSLARLSILLLPCSS